MKDDVADSSSRTLTPPTSEVADPIEERKSTGTLKNTNGGIRKEKSPSRYVHGLSTGGTEALTEISLHDAPASDSHHSSEAGLESTSIGLGASLSPSHPPDLPPRKRGSVSSTSSGLSTPPIHAPAVVSLQPRRGPFGWLRSASTSTKSPPPLPPRTSVTAVNYAHASAPNIDLLIARLEEQSKLIKEGDDKVKEEFAVGSEELRKSFERIQREHQPIEEEDEIDWGIIRLFLPLIMIRSMEQIDGLPANFGSDLALRSTKSTSIWNSRPLKRHCMANSVRFQESGPRTSLYQRPSLYFFASRKAHSKGHCQNIS